MENDNLSSVKIAEKMFIILFLSSLLSGCNSRYGAPSSPLMETQFTPTKTTTVETKEVITTPTSYMPSTYRKECISISDSFSTVDDPYIPIIAGKISKDYYPDTGFEELINDDAHHINYFATSPDGVWMSYKLIEMDPETKKLKSEKLVVSSISRNKTYEYPWTDSWVYMYWVNNEEIIITSIESDSILLTLKLTVFNPFTNSKKTLRTDFPEQTIGSDFSFWMRTGDSRYNADFTDVIYRGYDTSENYTLYSLSNKSITMKVNSYDTESNIPVWSPDGGYVAVAISKTITDGSIEELFIYSVNGTSKQVTGFGSENYQYANIGFVSWSLDNKYLAFWVKLDQDLNNSLFVYDIQNDSLVDYCLPGDYGGPFAVVVGISDHFTAPLWSPDGSQILISKRDEDNIFYTVLFSIDQKKAKIIAQDAWPVGWIKK